ncbi:CAP domain-containing protein, partial [Streptomyces sp. G44]|uniref:CAP domain-containing protein n=1 Tax=Streptomyces sp. G44 TaxID=2807632 RepID=UPI00195FEC63
AVDLLTGPEAQETAPATAAAPGSATPSAPGPAAKSASPSPKRSASPSAKPSTGKKKKPKKAKAKAKPSPAPTRTTPRPKPKPKPGPGAPDPAPAPPSGTAEQVVALVNTERAKAGCGPVRSNGKLAAAATKHSADMAARDYFDHTSPDGTDPGDRITAAGYRWSTYGENIARGQRTPASVMDSWMKSPGHRANILNCDFKELGVGVHNASGGPWWTQAFGTAG